MSEKSRVNLDEKVTTEWQGMKDEYKEEGYTA